MFAMLRNFFGYPRECLPGVAAAAVPLPALPIAYLFVYGGALGAFLTLVLAGHPLLLAAFAVQMLLGAFGTLLFRAKR
ncbi:hypothetical protein AB0K52_22480 [Glycomyces sp. NPDC049804]|uniref:hypothetical protein n=1 Tax=Glycomyces sp. NPDC049804 TaxID=3154363 RepID=UPI003433F579